MVATLVFDEIDVSEANFRVPKVEWSFMLQPGSNDIHLRLSKTDRMVEKWSDNLKKIRFIVDGVDANTGLKWTP